MDHNFDRNLGQKRDHYSSLPLVSIIVITYNSEKYILDTLESIKAQTYKNIEVIISDDCSTDNTLEICRYWISLNKERFYRAELITFSVNTGVTANCNRGLYSSQGKWLKLIAGDDTLTNNSVSSFIDFSHEHPSAKFIVSNINIINESGIVIGSRIHSAKKFSLNKQRLLRNILKSYFISAPGIFIEKETLIAVGGFDERFEMQEDYPLFVRLAQNKIDFYYLNQFLVNYRENTQSIFHKYKSDTKSQITIRHFNSTKCFCYTVLLPSLKKEKMILSYIRLYLYIKKEEKRISNQSSYHIYNFLFYLDPERVIYRSKTLLINLFKFSFGDRIYDKIRNYLRS